MDYNRFNSKYILIRYDNPGVIINLEIVFKIINRELIVTFLKMGNNLSFNIKLLQGEENDYNNTKCWRNY